MLPGGVEERPELGGCLYSPRFGAGLARSFCPFDRIGQQDLVNDYGVTERLAQHRMDILDGARGQTRAVPATVCGQLAVELRETSRAHGLEPQLADIRPDMPVDQVAIVLQGLGLDLYCTSTAWASSHWSR